MKTMQEIIQASPFHALREHDHPTQVMAGLTPYYDEGTMRAFRCKVSRSTVIDGVALVAICRQDVTHDHKRGYLIVSHDLTGYCIDRTNVNKHYTTLRAAEKAFWRTVNALDPHEVLRNALARELRNQRRAAASTAAALKMMGSR